MDFLYHNRLKYQPILHTLEHEAYEHLTVVGHSISLYAPASELWMMSLDPADDYETVWPDAEVSLLLLIGKTGLEEIEPRYGLSQVQQCHQFVHLAGEAIVPDTDLVIRPLTLDYLDFVDERYHAATREDLHEKIELGTMFGGFLGKELVGFIGTHDEGSMGLLYIVEQHRRKGYAEVLESWLANHKLSQGLIPFGHVEVGNHKSLQLQRKVGAVEAPERVFWIW